MSAVATIPASVVSPSIIFLPSQVVPQEKVLDQAEFGQMLLTHFASVGARPVTFTAVTVPAVIAACPVRHDIVKVAQVRGWVNVNYGNAVRRARAKEGLTGAWEAAERQWGERVAGTPFVIHPENKKLYLSIIHPKSKGYCYRSLDGRTLYDTAEINRFLRKSGNRQGLSEGKAVIYRDYTLTNLIAVTFPKNHRLGTPMQTFLVVHHKA